MKNERRGDGRIRRQGRGVDERCKLISKSSPIESNSDDGAGPRQDGQRGSHGAHFCTGHERELRRREWMSRQWRRMPECKRDRRARGRKEKRDKRKRQKGDGDEL